MTATFPGSSAPTVPAPPPGGLDEEEALRRRARYGFNEIPEPAAHPVRQFLGYFWGPIPGMIEAALALGLLLENWSDVALILALLIVNGLVAFWEERQAGNAVRALQAHLAPQARLVRGGVWRVGPARELVPGDRIRVRIGDIVPADARVEAGGALEVDESALTGESLPVARGPGERLFAGAVVRRGEADAVVESIGAATFFGRTARLLGVRPAPSHFQRAVLRIGDFLIAVAIALAIVIEIVALVRGIDLVTTLQFALVLTVAAIPVAMPTVLSVTMAVGARRLAGEGAIVSRLAALEELAGVDVLCSDKTGTLTQNRLTVGEPFCLPGVTTAEVLAAAALASRAEDHDPIDDAVLARAAGLPAVRPRVDSFQPFDPVTKRTEARATTAAGGVVRAAKGAPQAIVALCDRPDALRAAIGPAIAEFARRGFRALAVARSNAASGPWTFLGVLPLSDPLRSDSRALIAELAALSVDVKMVTGDQAAIAGEVARQLGLGARLETMGGAGADDAGRAAARSPETVDVFAQVRPEDKYAIVAALQAQGHIVAMTGDGVNDAPALKRADAGIAVPGATDAARAAAALVLTSAGLAVILTAIREARQIFQRMTAYAIYRIEETIRLLAFITASIVLLGFFPLTPTMIVLIALLNDGAILTIAYDRARVSARPVRWRMDRVLGVATALGVTGFASSLLFLGLASTVFHVAGGPLQTLIYLKLSVAGHLVIFLTRTEGPFWRSRPAGVLVAAVLGTQLAATGIAVSGFLVTPIPWTWALLVWGYAGAEFALDEAAKLAAYRALRSRPDRPGVGPGRTPKEGGWFFPPRFRAPKVSVPGTAPASGAARSAGCTPAAPRPVESTAHMRVTDGAAV